jgi:hypothetical protein
MPYTFLISLLGLILQPEDEIIVYMMQDQRKKDYIYKKL